MKHVWSAVATVAGGIATVAFTTAMAPSEMPETGGAGSGSTGLAPHDPPTYPEYEPRYEVQVRSVDDGTAEAVQAGVAALGGAGVAVAGMWLVGRRRTHVA